MNGQCSCDANALDGAGGGTGGNLLDLVVTGNTQLGDTAVDTLIVNATSTFNNNVQLGNTVGDTLVVGATSTFNGAATFNNNLTCYGDYTQIGNNQTDTLSVVSTTEFYNDVTIGNTTADSLYVIANSTFVNGLFRNTRNTIASAPAANTITITDISSSANTIIVHFYNLSTASTTARPYVQLYNTTLDNTLLFGNIVHTNGTSQTWTNSQIYLWGDTWGGANELVGNITFTKAGYGAAGKPIFTIQTQISIGTTTMSSGQGIITLVTDGNDYTVRLIAGGGVNWDGGYYSVTYI